MQTRTVKRHPEGPRAEARSPQFIASAALPTLPASCGRFPRLQLG